MCKKIYVFGAATFIGSHLVEKLLLKGYEVVGIDYIELHKAPNLEFSSSQPNFHYFPVDYFEIKTFEIIPFEKNSTVYHFFTLHEESIHYKNPEHIINFNIFVTKNILDICKKFDLSIIMSSSSEIYGKNPNLPWSEDADRVLGPTSVHRWSYSTAKALGEHMVQGFHQQTKLPYTILRFFNPYGPRQNPYYIIPKFIINLSQGHPLDIYGNGTQSRSFTYVKDIVEASLKSLENKKAQNEIFNIGTTEEMKIIDLISLISGLIKKEPTLRKIDPRSKIHQNFEDSERRLPDITKADHFLQWSPKYSLKEGLKETIEWFKENDKIFLG